MSGSKYSRLKTIACLLAVFLGGLVVGSVVTIRVIQRHYRERMDSATWTPRTMAWLESKLRLAQEQQSQVRPVVERSMQKMADLRASVESDRKQLFGEMFVEVAKHLTDEQRQKLRQAVRDAGAKQTSPMGGP